MATWKEKYNKKYQYKKNKSHNLSDISKDTGVSRSGLQKIYNKGIGAYKTNPQSVRPNVTSKEQWAMARVYSSVMGGKASKIDKKELNMEKGGSTDFNPDGNIKDKVVHASGDAGGMLVGKRHSNGGIKALNKSTGQPLEMEGGEVVITRNAVSDNKKRSFNGKMLTNRQILSEINESGGGVSFADGGKVPNNVKFDCNAEYEYGGKTMCGKDLAYALGGEVDLFEQYDKQPKELSEIVQMYEERYVDGDMDYKDSQKFLKEVNAIGYTFDLGLDNEPYNLRPMMAKGGEVKWIKNIDEEFGWNENPYDHIGGYISEDGDYKIYQEGKWVTRDFGETFIRKGDWTVDYKNKPIGYGSSERMYLSNLKDAKEFVSQINNEKFAKGGTIECGSCDWSWDEKDGGDDMYVCHKCGTDNTNEYKNGGITIKNNNNNMKKNNLIKTKRKGKNIMTFAKEIRKKDESWQDALKRAKIEMNKTNSKKSSNIDSELGKLKELIKEDKILKEYNYSKKNTKKSNTRLQKGGDVMSLGIANADAVYNKGGKLSKDDAITKALKLGVDFNKDFHSQSFGNELSELAKETGYRKSKSSSGSLGRSFFNHLQKIYDKNSSYYDSTLNSKGYAKGGEIDGRYKVLLEKRDNSGKLYPPNLYWKGNDKNLIAEKVKEAKKDFPARKVFVTDEVGDREIYNYAKGGMTKKGAFERVLKDSQFGNYKGTPSNEFKHNRLPKTAVIGKNSVSITSYTPNTKRYLDSQTFTSPKELAEYLDKNQIYAKGGSLPKDEFRDGIGNTAFQLVEEGGGNATLGEYVEKGIHNYVDKFYAKGGKFADGGIVDNYKNSVKLYYNDGRKDSTSGVSTKHDKFLLVSENRLDEIKSTDNYSDGFWQYPNKDIAPVPVLVLQKNERSNDLYAVPLRNYEAKDIMEFGGNYVGEYFLGAIGLFDRRNLSGRDADDISSYNQGTPRYAKGGKTQGGKFQVEIHWKGLSKDKTIGKYIITEKTLDELEEQWLHIVSIDVLNNSNKKPISWFELKKELFSKGRDKGLFAKGGLTYADGGTIGEYPRVYIADLEAYNNGELKGEWLDLADYNDSEEFNDAVQDLLDGWGVEEYAIHDVENFPDGMYSEYMGTSDFDEIYDMIELAKNNDLPLDVVMEVVSQYDESAVEEYQGQYEDGEDFAYQLIDDIGLENFSDPQYFVDIYPTDRRILAQEMADSYTDDIAYEDDGERVVEEAGLDVDEYRELDGEDDDKRDEILEEAKEIVRDEYYETWYDGLDDPYEFLVNEQGLYSAEDFFKANFIQIDYGELANALEQDYLFIENDKGLFVFNVR